MTVLKETPVTVNGHDYLKQLVHNDDMSALIACDLCVYRSWSGKNESQCDCCTAHGCTTDPETYYLLAEV